jgi:ABC-type transport system involved in cytochrome bd biosynthesis fused ATPase/permease subunit
VKRKLIIATVIIILLVVYYLLGTGYMKRSQEREALTSQIADVTQTVSELPEPAQDLELRLAEAQASLAAEQDTFPSQMNSTQVINAILELADDCEVKAIPLITQPWAIEAVGEHNYHIFRLNLALEGSLAQLLTFVSELENGEFKTLVVENLSITEVTEPPEEESASEETISVIASLDVAIYARTLASD